ncbi:MAG: SH3 domain-containing protein [Desulfobacteraceae bacterium]|nr:MAG: SH3 domain-containing protein [Desulfobacteraceae bacterium]
MKKLKIRPFYWVVVAGIFAATSMAWTQDAFASRDRRDRGIRSLPRGHGKAVVGGIKYYHHGGRFYRRGHTGFISVRAPIGFVVSSLPIGFSLFVSSGVPYYHYSDVYYRRAPAGYIVVEPPPEVVVVQEPPPASPPVWATSGDRVAVSAQRLNVRSGPGINFSVIHIASQGQTMDVKGRSPGWLYVGISSEKFGWVQEQYTTPVFEVPAG